jgi:D-threonine aldolase
MNAFEAAEAAYLHSLIGHSVNTIDTPALVLDLDAMERNLALMQGFANAHGVKLRPHAKMHKSAQIAKLQMAAGAVGVCVQKVSEADALAAAGVRDIYISNEVVSLQKCERIMAILRRHWSEKIKNEGIFKLAVAVDSLLGVKRLGEAMQGLLSSLPKASLQALDVFIEIDVGQGRCGVTPGNAAVPLADEIACWPGLRFAGLQAYHGRAQHLRSAVERRLAIEAELAKVGATLGALLHAGHTVTLVTGAGSGTFALEAASGVYGELQAGSYLFMDADYAANEADPAQPVFEHALFVKSCVMSLHTQGADPRAVVDAGHKSHAIDSGLPRVHGRAPGQELVFANGGDEHGILRGNTPDAPLPQLGDTVWLIPGHCDPTVNLHNHMLGLRGGLASGVVERIIRVDARGALT